MQPVHLNKGRLPESGQIPSALSEERDNKLATMPSLAWMWVMASRARHFCPQGQKRPSHSPFVDSCFHNWLDYSHLTAVGREGWGSQFT